MRGHRADPRRARCIARDTADGLRDAYAADSLADVYVKAMGASSLRSDRTGFMPLREYGLAHGRGRARDRRAAGSVGADATNSGRTV